MLRRAPAISHLQRRGLSTSPWDKLVFSEEVQHAVQTGRPVVALESAIITHGMAYPLNRDVTNDLQAIIRREGAVPAVIGVMGGRPTIGLSPSELERLSDPANKASVRKVSRRDLPMVISMKSDGGTTVAGTMILAKLAGIDVFATGGIGGVHRKGEITMDVSADLMELGRTPVAVVCAGAKSILDIGRTIEYLETQGVPVVTLGPTTDFPAFYTTKSGFSAPWNAETVDQAAAIVHQALSLPDPLSTLLCVPIPAEWEGAGKLIQEAVEQAVASAEREKVIGKDITPWILAEVSRLTKGTAVKSNIALIENNASVAAKLAIQLAHLRSSPKISKDRTHSVLLPSSLVRETAPATGPSASSGPALVVVVGCAAVDITTQAFPSSSPLQPHTTHPGSIRLTPGGVGLNVALAASRLLSPGQVSLVAPVQKDDLGRVLRAQMEGLGLRTDGLWVADPEGPSTAACSLVLDAEGGLQGGVAAMEIVEKLDIQHISSVIQRSCPRLVAFDGNLSSSGMTATVSHCNKLGVPALFEPTSLPKTLRIVEALSKGGLVGFWSPNLSELRHLWEHLAAGPLLDSPAYFEQLDGLGLGSEWRDGVQRWSKVNGAQWMSSEGVVQMLVALSPFFQNQVVKLGHRGVVTLRRSASGAAFVKPEPGARHVFAHSSLRLSYHPPTSLPAGEILSTTGAGDSLVGAVIAGLAQHQGIDVVQDDRAWTRLIERGQQAARASLRSEAAVSPLLGQVEEEWRLE